MKKRKEKKKDEEKLEDQCHPNESISNETHLSEVSLYKRSIQMEWNFCVQIRLFYHLTEFIIIHRAISICVE